MNQSGVLYLYYHFWIVLIVTLYCVLYWRSAMDKKRISVTVLCGSY